MIVLRHEWPEFYKLLEKDVHLLDTINNYFNPRISVTDGSNSQSSVKIKEIFGNIQNDGLEEFLNATQYYTTTNLLPFLRLNQESYEAGIAGDKFELDVNSNKIEFVRTTITNANDEDKTKYAKKLCSINDEHAKDRTIPTLLISIGVLISAIDLVSNAEVRKTAVDNIGKHLISSLRNDISKYDMNKIFGLINEMSHNFQTALYNIFIELIKTDTTINPDIIKNFLSNNSSISQEILDNLEQKLIDIIPEHENDLLEIIRQTCGTENWNSNNFKKPVRFIKFIINRITFDNSDIDNKRVDTYKSLYAFISLDDKAIFIDHLKNTMNIITQTPVLPPRILESINSINFADLQELEPNIEKLLDSMISASTILTDINQKKDILEILVRLLSEGNQ